MTNSKTKQFNFKKNLLVIAFVSAYSSHAPAAVEHHGYVGFQYSMFTYDEDGDEAEPTAFVASSGKYINDWLAIEVRIGVGLEDDPLEVGSLKIDVEVERILGLYGVFHVGNIRNVSLYGIMGYTNIEVEASAYGISISEDEVGFSYGVGINIGAINIEFMNYLEEYYYDVTALSLGYIYRF